VHEQLSTPDFYKDEGQNLAQINVRLEAIENELQVLYERWQVLDELS